MRTSSAWAIVFMVSTVTLSGCFGGDDGNGPEGEPSTADAAANSYDRALGENGYRISGTVTGTAEAIMPSSAVQLDILDNVQTDGSSPGDLATFILNVEQTGLNVQAQLRSMASASEAGSEADHFGGAGRNVRIFGPTGVGPSELPETQAFMFGVGIASMKIGDGPVVRRLVYVAVTEGLRDASQAPVPTPDANNLQLHVVFPGETMDLEEIPGVPDGFLYYYFEEISLLTLGEEDRAKIGETLEEPEAENVPPIADGKVLVGGEVATSTVQEGKSNASTPVTLDGVASSDSDGNLTRYVWRIYELSNGTYGPNATAVLQGQRVVYNFTKAGPKQINLTVTDDRGASSTDVIPFYVNFHSRVPGVGSFHTQGPHGGADCAETINCFKHTSTISDGVVSGTYTVHPNGTEMLEGVRIEVFVEGEADRASDEAIKKGESPLAVTAEEYGDHNRFTVYVWYTFADAGGADTNPNDADGVYDFEAAVNYEPAAAE